MENASLKRCTEEFGFWLDASALLRDFSVMFLNARRTGTSICPRHTATRSLLSDREEYARQLLKWTSWEAMIAGNCMSFSKCSVFVRDQRTGAKGKNAICNCQPFTLPFWSKRERGKNGAIVQMKEKKNNSQPSSFFYQLPSLLRQRKHLVPSVPPEKRGKKERSETLHPKCQWGQRGCQLPRTTRCWETASLNEGCAFRKPS